MTVRIGLDPASPSTQRFGRQTRGEFIALLASSTAMVALAIDSTLPAFGAVREEFGLAPDSTRVALTITLFFLGLGLGQFAYGPLSDRFGRRPVLLASIAIYVVAGLGTALAPSLEVILGLRFIWGLAAAGPRVVVLAIVRDRFSGDQMAKVMSIMFAIFLVVPALAPAVGKLALELGSWRATFALPPLVAILLGVWAFRLDESLSPDARRSLDLGAIGSATRQVLTNRHTVGHMLALTFGLSAFLPYLASGERIYGQIYGEGDRFALWFGISSVAIAVAAITASRNVERFGAARVLWFVLTSFVSFALVLTLASLTTNGVPPFWLFFGVTTLILASFGVALAMLNSISMEPMGHIAGTASATIGTFSFVGAALLSSVVDRLIGATLIPFAVSFVIFAILAMLATLWATETTSQQTTAAG